MKKLVYLSFLGTRFSGGVIFFLGLTASLTCADNATNAPPVSANPDILFNYNQYAGFIPPGQEKPVFTTSLNTVTASDPYTGLATGTLVQQQALTAYQKNLTDDVTVRYEDQVVTDPTIIAPKVNSPISQAQSEQHKLSLQVVPANQLTVSGNVHAGTNQTDPFSNPAATTGVGLGVAAPLPLKAQLSLSANADKVTSASLFGPASQSDSWQAQVEQPLGTLPVKAVVSGGETTTVSSGTTARAPTLEQALVLKVRPEDTLRVGLREMQYVEMSDSEYSNTLYADFSHQLTPQMTWHSYADMFQMQGMEAMSSSQQNLEPNLSPVDSKSVTFATGPAISLRNDMIARVQFSNTWDKSIQGPGSEQRISLSINGSF